MLQVLILPRPLPKAFNAVEPFAASYTSCNDLLAWTDGVRSG